MAKRKTRYAFAVQFNDGIVVKSLDAEEYLEQNFLNYIDLHHSQIARSEGKYFFDSVQESAGMYYITFHAIQDLCGECDANGVHSFDECTDSEHALQHQVEYKSIELAEQVEVIF